MPQASLIEQVNQHMPGSAREFHRVLWTALDVDKPIGRRANALLGQLELGIQRAIFASISSAGSKSGWREPSNGRLVDSLAGKACLDSLAAVTIFTRTAIEQDNQGLAFFWARETYYTLIKLGLEMYRRGIGYDIVNLYRNFIFSKIRWQGCQFHDSEFDIVKAGAWIATLPYETPGARDRRLSWEQRVELMSLLLKGRFGWDVFFAMRPQWIPVDWNADADARLGFVRAQRLRHWGWQSVTGQASPSDWPPMDVFMKS